VCWAVPCLTPRTFSVAVGLGNSSLRIWWECRVCDRAAQKSERLLERTVVLPVRRYVGLRARFLGTFRP
jgi:hypothetical protein